MWQLSTIEKSRCFILAHPGQSWAGFAEIIGGLGEVTQEGTLGAVMGGLGRSWGGLGVVLGIVYVWRVAVFLGIRFTWGVCMFVVRGGQCFKMAYGEPKMAPREPKKG